MDNIIEVLATSETFPEETVRYCLDHPDEVVPDFLDLLRDYAENPDLIDQRAEAVVLSTHILGELGEKRAFGPLMDVLTSDRERVDDIFGDAKTETIPQILISLFDGDTDRLYRTMDDPSVDDFVCHGVLMAWTYEVASGRIGLEEAEGYLIALYEDLRSRAERNSYVWVGWAESIGFLGLSSLNPLVEQAIDNELVNGVLFDRQDFDSILKDRRAAPDAVTFLAGERVKPFRDAIGTMSKWHCYSQEYLDEMSRLAEDVPWDPSALWSETVTNPFRDVGRNDPCPCGSGKKYKQCCLR